MRALPKLVIVACYGVGTDAIDLAHAGARAAGIRVTNIPDVLTDDVTDMAVALLLAAARLIPQGDAEIRRGGWAMPLTTCVSGKAVGIVGMGRIGAAVAKRLAAFDTDIAYFDRTPRPDSPYAFEPDLRALARRSEFLVLTVAASDATRGYRRRRVLDALGPDGILVNVSRGSTVDEPDLHYYQHGGFGTVRLKEPMILGHEVAGRVVAVGEGVDGLAPGTASPSRRAAPAAPALSRG